jgi:hypothetical protein
MWRPREKRCRGKEHWMCTTRSPCQLGMTPVTTKRRTPLGKVDRYACVMKHGECCYDTKRTGQPGQSTSLNPRGSLPSSRSAGLHSPPPSPPAAEWRTRRAGRTRWRCTCTRGPSCRARAGRRPRSRRIACAGSSRAAMPRRLGWDHQAGTDRTQVCIRLGSFISVRARLRGSLTSP